MSPAHTVHLNKIRAMSCQEFAFGGKVAETGDCWNPWGRKGLRGKRRLYGGVVVELSAGKVLGLSRSY